MPHIGEFLVRQQNPLNLPTLSGAWVIFNPAFSQPAYWKDEQGVVHIQGVVSGGAVPSAIFTLPVGMRPAQRLILATVSNNLFAMIDIQTNGTVNANAGSNASFSLEGVTFRAAQ